MASGKKLSLIESFILGFKRDPIIGFMILFMLFLLSIVATLTIFCVVGLINSVLH
jgi:hypothetical protein